MIIYVTDQILVQPSEYVIDNNIGELIFVLDWCNSSTKLVIAFTNWFIWYWWKSNFASNLLTRRWRSEVPWYSPSAKVTCLFEETYVNNPVSPCACVVVNGDDMNVERLNNDSDDVEESLNS